MSDIGSGEGGLNKEPEIRVEKLDLKKLHVARQFSDFIEQNRKYFMEFEGIRQNSYPNVQRIRALHHTQPRTMHFGIFTESDELVGTIALAQEASQATVASFGYLVAKKHTKENIASRAVREVIRMNPKYKVFFAAMEPSNIPSQKVAEKAGFTLVPQDQYNEMREKITDVLYRYQR